MSFLHKNIFNISPHPFGLDVSDLSLKAALLEREGDVDRIAGYGSVALPVGTVVDGEIMNEEALVSAVRTLMDTAQPKHIRKREVVCSLPEVKAFLRIINLPRMEEFEIAEALKWEIEANIPLSLDQVYYDWQLLDRSFSREKNKLSVLVVAVAGSVIDRFIHALEAAGLEVVGMETESLAQARSLLVGDMDKDKTTVIVDIGDRRTSLLMAIGTIPCFTSSVPLSGNMMTDAIAKGMKVSFDEAEKLKLTYGIGSFLKKDPIFRSVEPVLEGLRSEIQRSIEFYLSGLKYSSSVDRVVLCGGGSQMRGLAAYFSQQLQLPTEEGSPWVNVRLGSALPPIERSQAVRYSTAIGLALSGMKDYAY